LVGCKYDVNSTGSALRSPLGVTGVPVAVSVPADGADGRPHVYVDSGKLTAANLVFVLRNRGATVASGAVASSGGLRIMPTIVSWVDRASTGGFNRGDTIKVRLVVQDAAGKVLDDRIVTARADPDTFRQARPEALLRSLFEEWADRIFGKAKA
jgi:hypothetical protein